MAAESIPVVDFELLVGLGSKEAKAEDTSEVLHKALCTVGFVYLVNHGISEELVSLLGFTYRSSMSSETYM